MTIGVALRHVLRNAIEAIGRDGDGGSIQVGLTRGDYGDAIIRIVDDGPGLPDDPRLFKPFWSTLPGRFGLGLAVARTIAESHGGRLRAIPRAGRGAEIEFSFPAPR